MKDLNHLSYRQNIELFKFQLALLFVVHKLQVFDRRSRHHLALSHSEKTKKSCGTD